jgi:hypothetical protein
MVNLIINKIPQTIFHFLIQINPSELGPIKPRRFFGRNFKFKIFI